MLVKCVTLSTTFASCAGAGLAACETIMTNSRLQCSFQQHIPTWHRLETWGGLLRGLSIRDALLPAQRQSRTAELEILSGALRLVRAVDHLHDVHRRFFFQAEDGIRDVAVTGVQTCALPI